MPHANGLLGLPNPAMNSLFFIWGSDAGYCGRWFAAHQVGARIALAFEAQILTDIPTDDSDLPVDLLVTEQRVITARTNEHYRP
jgi:hypothetical protein